MDNATSGEIILDGKNVTALDKRGMTQFRRNDVGKAAQGSFEGVLQALLP